MLYVWGMDTIQRTKREYRSWKNGYYHLSSDGWQQGKLFYTREQYAYGMTVMGLFTLRFKLCIYDFTLMPNHFHILLSGSGEDCVQAFDYYKRKISARLVKDGFPPLPGSYFFKLTPITDEHQLRINFLYVDRNVLEKGISLPGGYTWGAAYLYYSFLGNYLKGESAASLPKYTGLEKLTGSRIQIPPSWQFHPELGLLPASFVDTHLFQRLFPSPKTYQTLLVKEYEAFVKLGKSIGEEVVFSKDEIAGIVQQQLQRQYPGRSVRDLSNDEKGRLAVSLEAKYSLTCQQIASALSLPEYLVQQLLHSKDFGSSRSYASSTSHYEKKGR